MKTKNQVLLLKLAYILVIVLALIYNYGDMQKGFIDASTGVDRSLHPVAIIALIFATIIGIGIVLNIYFFINSIQNNSVFSLLNISRITMIGWFCISQAVLLYAFYFFEANGKINNNSIYQKIVGVDFDFWLVIFGITMLIIGFVFKKGIELQKEQELTI
ncbi:DUF2975 domain-containing protein [Pedobacter cryotolerans]|uniref:DUF2975 domain-containing protein n=1 Tax=Pedobacter cryotolerans TaxID=2571270 RepID=A0A4U1C608_9SPHI|nr:DUF2975 domain-containing protein [Pedobacter cryotolerans]TKB99988.1 DUF2975 domain-containing protein [Pedobacter cryotolerans]